MQAENAKAPRTGVLVLGVFVAAVVSMAGSLAGEFLFDDVPLILGNHYVHSFDYWTHWFTGTLWETNFSPTPESEARGFWRPIILASYTWDWWVMNGNPLAFHLTNLLVHGCNATLFFLLLRGWVKSTSAAVIGALVFAIHPAQTEPVAWIAGRTDVFCAFGMLSALMGLRLKQHKPIQGLLLTLAGTFIAFASKEAAVVLPALVVIEVWGHTKPALTPSSVRALLKPALPFLAVSAAYVVVHQLSVQTERVAEGLTSQNHIPLIFEAVGHYAKLTVFPINLTLGQALLRFKDGLIQPNYGYAALGTLTVFGIVTLAWRLRLRSPAISLGLLAYLAMLIPVSGIVWLHYDILASPRFLYEPLLGFSVAVAGCVDSAKERYDSRMIAGAAAPALLLLAGVSFLRSIDFESEAKFWRKEITKNPDYGPAQEYFVTQELNAGRPHSALKLSHLWFANSTKNELPESTRAALALRIVEASLALTPDIDAVALTAIRDFATSLTRKDESKSTLKLDNVGLAVVVGNDPLLRANLYKNRRALNLLAAQAESRLGQDAAALTSIQEVLADCRDCWTLLPNTALILARAGQFKKAQELANHGRQIAPPNVMAATLEALSQARIWRQQLGVSGSPLAKAAYLSALGAFGRAYAAAKPAYESPPEDSDAIANLAELALRAGDKSVALELMSRIAPNSVIEQWLQSITTSVQWMENPPPLGHWLPTEK